MGNILVALSFGLALGIYIGQHVVIKCWDVFNWSGCFVGQF